MRAFHQELAHFALHHRPDAVLWCDGDHGFDPYAFAELNLTRGFDADHGADRLLIKRCMTPFQWDTVLTRHLDHKLLNTKASLVLAAPYDALFSTDELKDWEQEDYVAYSLKHLRDLAHQHEVPILLSVDMAKWWRSHPILARQTYEAAEARWSVQRVGDAWKAVDEAGTEVLGPRALRQATIWDSAPKPRPMPVQNRRGFK